MTAIEQRETKSAAITGLLAGGIAGVIVLCVLAVLLLRIDGVTWKVLVAVWLWSVPVLGTFSGVGRLIGAGFAHTRAQPHSGRQDNGSDNR